MDADHADRLLSEPPEIPNQQHERTGSMSLGAPPTGDDVSPINGDSADPNAKVVNDVVNSEIGVATLLNRLKQSIASAKEFALFLKHRSKLEEMHSDGLKKLCRITAENIRRPDQRHGSYLQSYEEVTMIHERMADNGAQFSISLNQMHQDLLDLAANVEHSRKQWKTSGLANEQRVAELEASMRKSKAKYDSFAEDYDRARTGDRQAGKKFGLKGPKSAAQHEEDLLKKVQAADQLYNSQVNQVRSQRDELWTKSRPEAVKALQELIKECDSATTLQMQKFASFNEKLLLSNALNVSPMPGNDQGNQPRSLRQAVQAIDNDKDLSNYLISFGNKVPPRTAEIKYERNPVLNPPPAPQQTPPQRQSDPAASYGARHQGAPQSFGQPQSPHQTHISQPIAPGPPGAIQQHERSFSQGPPPQQYGGGPMGGMGDRTGSMGQPQQYSATNRPIGQMGERTGSLGMGLPQPYGAPQGGMGERTGSMGLQSRAPAQHAVYNTGSVSSSGPPQISTLPFQNSTTPPLVFGQQPQPSYTQSLANTNNNGNLPPPLKPVFGLSLDQLFDRDGSAVPMVVYQCIQAVDLFGLEIEGIYRLSGTSSHITKIKAMFDNDASKIDFRNPENFFHDVNSVAGLLKQFFRDLPDPLLTAAHYAGFIEAAKNEDDTVRRDSLHAIINALPDPNYATLRALTLHLNRVTESSASNRMNASNLAIVFGPTLMGASTGPNIQDAGWQVRVIDTILNNCYQIFDDD